MIISDDVLVVLVCAGRPLYRFADLDTACAEIKKMRSENLVAF